MDANDVGVREFEVAPGFRFSSLNFLTIIEEMLRQKLERDGLLQHAVVSQPTHAHAALAERALEVVAIKYPLSGGEHVFCSVRTSHRFHAIVGLATLLELQHLVLQAKGGEKLEGLPEHARLGLLHDPESVAARRRSSVWFAEISPTRA